MSNTAPARAGPSCEGGKDKKTRRRLRLSCVECTKRRQKCDRQTPCGLCKSRNVAHLCRWENVPVARPTPARPPVTAAKPDPPPSTVADSTSQPSIGDLTARIASLERTISLHNAQHSFFPPPQPEGLLATLTQYYSSSNFQPQNFQPLGYDPSNQSAYTSRFRNFPSEFRALSSTQQSIYSKPTSPQLSDTDETHRLLAEPQLEPDTYETTAAFAQLSFGHHGEYIGRGSVLCALFSLGPTSSARFVYAKSTDSLSAPRDPLPSSSLPNTVEALVACLPSRAMTMALVDGYFADVNWRFGIPEEWFMIACEQMWSALSFPNASGMEINTNWLSLLFSVLAFAPRDPDSEPGAVRSEQFFLYALTARRFAEDAYMTSPSFSPLESAADGTVLSCLAVPLLCNFLAERGRASESWKLVGNALRNAIAVGMHRDPAWKRWQVMSETEILLRTRAWWNLVTWDQLYSYILGRPAMMRREAFDVAAPRPNNPDGTRNLYDTFQSAFVQLCSLAGEAIEKCFSMAFPTGATVLEMDRKIKEWHSRLPLEFRDDFYHQHPSKDSSIRDSIVLSRYRYSLKSWYMSIRLKLHRSHMDQDSRVIPPPQAAHSALRKQSRKICIGIAADIIRFQCDTHDSIGVMGSNIVGSNWYFEGVFSMFDASVSMIAALAKLPSQERLSEAPIVLDRAIDVFEKVVEETGSMKGEIARMAIGVLSVLRRECGWRRDENDLTSGPTSATSASSLSPEYNQQFPPDQWLPSQISHSVPVFDQSHPFEPRQEPLQAGPDLYHHPFSSGPFEFPPPQNYPDREVWNINFNGPSFQVRM